jgi:hypothetical protein
MFKRKFTGYWHLLCGFLLTGLVIYPLGKSTAQVGSSQLTLLRTFKHSSGVYDVGWSFDNKYFAYTDHYGQVIVRDSSDWNVLSTFNCGVTTNERLAWSPIASILVVGCYIDNTINIESINEITIVKVNTGHQSPAWSLDGSQLAVPQRDSTIAILNSSFETILTLGESIARPLDIPAHIGFKWSPSGEYLASFGAGQLYSITLWDLRTQERIQDILYARDIHWSPDGNTFTVNVYDYSEHTSTTQTWTVSPPEMTTIIPLHVGYA